MALVGSVSKTYDGTVAATLTDANYSLSGVVNGDDVILDTVTQGAYDNRNAGAGKLVSVTGLGLSGVGHHPPQTVTALPGSFRRHERNRDRTGIHRIHPASLQRFRDQRLGFGKRQMHEARP